MTNINSIPNLKLTHELLVVSTVMKSVMISYEENFNYSIR